MNHLIFSFVFSFMFSLAKNLPYYVYINSVPKCGVHLAMKTISLILNNYKWVRGFDINFFKDHKNNKGFNTLYCSHGAGKDFIIFDEFFKHNPRKNFLVIRDPRDVVVSFAYFIKKYPFQWEGGDVKTINKLITEILESDILNSWYNSFYFDWLANNPKSFEIRFEDLIGSQGGGSDQKQIETLISMMEYLEVEPTDKLLKHVKDNLFGSTGTFREGKIGAWKKEFSDEQKVLFLEKYSDLLDKLCYSIDY